VCRTGAFCVSGILLQPFPQPSRRFGTGREHHRGGDWAQDRIVPDCIRALRCNRKITVRNPAAIRPWQHVLEPLAGYLLLAARLHEDKDGESVGAWNFGPDKMAGPCGPENSLTVERLVKAVVETWGSGQYVLADRSKAGGPAETGCLRLNCDKAYHQLGWRPLWDFDRTIQHTVAWYKNWLAGHDAWDLTTGQIADYMAAWSDRGEFSRDRRSYHYAEAVR